MVSGAGPSSIALAPRLWGDAQLTGCGHTVGGIGGPGGAGAGHFAIDLHSWYIGPNGDFWATGETDTFVGHGPPQSLDVRS